MEDSQIYGYVSAQFVELDSTDRSASSKTELRLRPCTSLDFEENLFQPHNQDYGDEYLDSNKDDMLCLDDLSIVELEGQYKHDDGGFLKLSIIKCDNVTDDGK